MNIEIKKYLLNKILYFGFLICILIFSIHLINYSSNKIIFKSNNIKIGIIENDKGEIDNIYCSYETYLISNTLSIIIITGILLLINKNYFYLIINASVIFTFIIALPILRYFLHIYISFKEILYFLSLFLFINFTFKSYGKNLFSYLFSRKEIRDKSYYFLFILIIFMINIDLSFNIEQILGYYNNFKLIFDYNNIEIMKINIHYINSCSLILNDFSSSILIFILIPFMIIFLAPYTLTLNKKTIVFDFTIYIILLLCSIYYFDLMHLICRQSQKTIFYILLEYSFIFLFCILAKIKKALFKSIILIL